MRYLVSVIIGICYVLPVKAQTESKTFDQKVSAQNIKTVVLKNTFGPITITGQNASEINISAEINMSADTEDQLQQLAREVQVSVEQRNDTLFIYDGSPWSCRPFPANRHCHFRYDSKEHGKYTIEYKVNVPTGLNIESSTVNDGEILISQIAGNVKVNNVNESIRLDDVWNVVEARTINGDLTARFTKIPESDGIFYALNGDINTEFPQNLSAEVDFKSFNGEFYTDFKYSSKTNTVVSKQQTKGQTRYKLEENKGVIIGNGGPVLKYETLNGNMYVKRILN